MSTTKNNKEVELNPIPESLLRLNENMLLCLLQNNQITKQVYESEIEKIKLNKHKEVIENYRITLNYEIANIKSRIAREIEILNRLGYNLKIYNKKLEVVLLNGKKEKGNKKENKENSNNKNKKIIYENKEFPTFKSLCDFLGLEVGFQSARVILDKNKIDYQVIEL